MSHGRHVVNRRLKTGSNFGTEASSYVNNIFIRYVWKVPLTEQADNVPVFFGVLKKQHLSAYRGKVYFYVRNCWIYGKDSGGRLFA